MKLRNWLFAATLLSPLAAQAQPGPLQYLPGIFRGYIGLPTWTTAKRPTAGAGQHLTGYNTDLGLQETWNGSAWSTAVQSDGSSLTTPMFGATIGGNNTIPLNKALAAALATGGGTVRIPGNYAGTTPYIAPNPSVLLEYDGPNINRRMALGTIASIAQDTNKVFAGVLPQGIGPSGNDNALLGIWAVDQGSGTNVATRYHYDLDLSIYKLNFGCTAERVALALCTTPALQGGMSGVNFAVFQDGPDSTSDPLLKSGSDILNGLMTCTNLIGYCQQYEMQTIIVDRSTLAVLRQTDVQIGGINTRPAEAGSWGLVLNSQVGTQTAAVYVNSLAGSNWGNAFENLFHGSENFAITDQGQIELSQATAWANGQVVTTGTLRQNLGNWYIVGFPGGTTATGSDPQCTSGNCTGADLIQWIYGGSGSDPIFVGSTNGTPLFQVPVQLRAVQASAVANITLAAMQGTPAGAISALQGSLVTRDDGGNGRTLYVKESGGFNSPTTSGYNPVVTTTVSTGLTATGTGSTCTGTLALTSRWNIVSTANGTGGVILTGSTMPDEQVIDNRGANAVPVCPPATTAQIDALGNNVPASVASNTKVGYLCVSATQCWTVR